jgi:hypothetical protein
MHAIKSGHPTPVLPIPYTAPDMPVSNGMIVMSVKMMVYSRTLNV